MDPNYAYIIIKKCLNCSIIAVIMHGHNNEQNHNWRIIGRGVTSLLWEEKSRALCTNNCYNQSFILGIAK